MSKEIGFELTLKEGHEAAIEKVTEALGKEGFGVLTSIDVKGTFSKKIGAEFRAYTILGACNPQLAYQALSADSHVGLMLPCNVTVEDANGGSLVRFINPEAMLAGFGGEGEGAMQTLAAEAKERLIRVKKALEQ